MAEHTGPPSWEKIFAERFARLGFITSLLGAAIMVAVLLGNLYIIPFKHTPDLWLRLLVLQGPAWSAFIGMIATASTYHGRWRILRRKERYTMRDDLLDQALNVPDRLQNLPNQLGCAARLGPVVLAGALLLCVITYVPTPIGVLGNAINSSLIGGATGNTPVAATATPMPVVSMPTPLPTSIPQPTATPMPATPTPLPMPTATPLPIVDFVVSPLSSQTKCPALPAITLTLDNTKSTLAVNWQISIKNIQDTNMPWATASAKSGNIAAGTTASLTLTPFDRLCYRTANGQTQTYQATISLTDGTDSQIFTETTFP